MQVSHLVGLVFGQMISQLRKRLSTGKIGEAREFRLGDESRCPLCRGPPRERRDSGAAGIRELAGFGCWRDSGAAGIRVLPGFGN